jgi:hypothetical protein
MHITSCNDSPRSSIVGVSTLTMLLGAAACLGGPATAPRLDEQTAGAVTHYQHVQPILAARGATCHYPGGIGPFSLLT